MNLVLWVVKNGVPFDVAASLPENMLLAWSIILGRFEGQDYDFEAMTWKRPGP